MGDLTRSCLLTARDLGRGWKTSQRWYEPKWKVKRPLIDPGIEEDGAAISTVVLMGSPDGVKQDMASHLLMFKSKNGQIYLRTAAAILPAESNALHRVRAYTTAFRECAGEMRRVMAGWSVPPEFANRVTVTSRRLKLPARAIGYQTLTSHGDAYPASDYRDVVIQRGRMVAGLGVHGHAGDFPDVVDVARLTALVAERLQAAAASLRPSRVRIPVFEPDPVADSVARQALMKLSDFPSAWRDRRLSEFGPDSGTSVFPGSLMFQLDELRPEPGMIGRAVAPERHVGWSHYIRHCVAVYTSERRAKTAASAAFKRSQPPKKARARPRARGSITAKHITPPRLAKDIRAIFRIKRWITPASRSVPAIDVTSVDTMAVIRRGRMVATYACAAKGEDVNTALGLLTKVVARLERAERRLHG